MFLTDLGLPIPLTPYSAVVLGLSLLVVLRVVRLVRDGRRRWRRRRAAARADRERDPLMRRAVAPPLFSQRDVGPDELTARLHAATGPLEVIEALRSADAAGPAASAREPELAVPMPSVRSAFASPAMTDPGAAMT